MMLPNSHKQKYCGFRSQVMEEWGDEANRAVIGRKDNGGVLQLQIYQRDNEALSVRCHDTSTLPTPKNMIMASLRAQTYTHRHAQKGVHEIINDRYLQSQRGVKKDVANQASRLDHISSTCLLGCPSSDNSIPLMPLEPCSGVAPVGEV